MINPNDSITNAFGELLDSAGNESLLNELMGYFESPQRNLQSEYRSSSNDPSAAMLDISGFCTVKNEWLTSSQKDQHDSSKCIKRQIFTNDTKNIGITTDNYFHFCDLDHNVKCCNSTTKIDTYITTSATKRQPKSAKSKPLQRVKVDLELWKSAKLEIRVQDVYCSKILLSHLEPKLRYERGTLVWVKMAGYPQWPAMVDNDPDLNTYYEVMSTNPQKVQYHVVFFDEDHLASRYWSLEKQLTHFCFKPFVSFNSIAIFKRFQTGLQQAKRAATMSIQERIDTFGFAAKLKNPKVILVEK